MRRVRFVVGVFLLANCWGAIAAQQCLTTSGQYGSLTVSSCADNPAGGVFNPLTADQIGTGYPMADGSGFALGNATGSLSCTFTLSHPVLTSSVRIEADVFNPNAVDPALPGDQLSVELNGNPYQFVASDIVQTPLGAGFISGETVAANANGSIENAPGTTSSSGVMQLANNAPAQFSTIKVSMQSNGGGTPLRLCLDDAAPAITAPVPATSHGTLALLSAGLLLAGALLFRRRVQQG